MEASAEYSCRGGGKKIKVRFHIDNHDNDDDDDDDDDDESIEDALVHRLAVDFNITVH